MGLHPVPAHQPAEMRTASLPPYLRLPATHLMQLALRKRRLREMLGQAVGYSEQRQQQAWELPEVGFLGLHQQPRLHRWSAEQGPLGFLHHLAEMGSSWDSGMPLLQPSLP